MMGFFYGFFMGYIFCLLIETIQTQRLFRRIESILDGKHNDDK